jgi:hypothetical protein
VRLNTNHDKNLTDTTSYAGLKIYEDLWEKYNISRIIDLTYHKQSGKPLSAILKNLFFRLLAEANSLNALSEIDKQDYFFHKNVSLHRTNYGRNMDKLDNNGIQRLLDNINLQTMRNKKIRKDALLIYDQTAIQAEGETYENAKNVWDNTQEKVIRGYELGKVLLDNGKQDFPVNFKLQDDSKPTIINQLKAARRLYNINKAVFDAGVRGMEFFMKLHKEGFLFYTKATSNWYFNFGKDYSINELKEKYKSLVKRNGILSRIVYKDDMKLRLIFVDGDNDVYLTNDFNIKSYKVVEIYYRRWNIETSFREEKQELGLDILPSTKFNRIKIHILLVLLAYLLSQFILEKRKISKIAKGIKKIKRFVVKTWAIVRITSCRIKLKFHTRFKRNWIFELDYG